jgi:hypothetical protein
MDAAGARSGSPETCDPLRGMTVRPAWINGPFCPPERRADDGGSRPMSTLAA